MGVRKISTKWSTHSIFQIDSFWYTVHTSYSAVNTCVPMRAGHCLGSLEYIRLKLWSFGALNRPIPL